jgi:hypothetical protein
MMIWTTIVISSATIGFLCSCFMKGLPGLLTAAAMPALGLLAFLLYQEYYQPSTGGGASMWPIALLFGGTIGGATSVLVFVFNQQRLKKRK